MGAFNSLSNHILYLTRYISWYILIAEGDDNYVSKGFWKLRFGFFYHIIATENWIVSQSIAYNSTLLSESELTESNNIIY